MAFTRTIGLMFTSVTFLGAVFPSHALAVPMVTYSWTTTSEGYGPHVSAPASATFEVPLSDVISGAITQADVTDIQMTYPGVTFNSAATSGIGFDFSAYVSPNTGDFIYHDANQGLAVIAFAGTDINLATTFLSITVDNPNPTFSGVSDQFNALNSGNPYAGYPTAGYWTASFPPPVPESSTWAMMLLGFAGLGVAGFSRARVRIAIA